MNGVTTTVAKWGNSVGIRVPKHIIRNADLEIGSVVRIQTCEHGICIVPERRKPKYSLDDLLSQITSDERHGEHFVEPVGQEIL